MVAWIARLSCVAAILRACVGLQLLEPGYNHRTVDSKELAAFVQSGDGIMHTVVTRVQEDIQGLMPEPAANVLLGLVQEEQEPSGGHLNPSYRDKKKQDQARHDMMVNIIMQAILIALFAMVYHTYKVPPPVDPALTVADREALNVEWNSGYFACFNDLQICLVGCCCPLVLWSDNVSLAHILAFTTAIAIALCFTVAQAFVPFVFPVFVGVMVWARSKLRQKFNMPFNTASVLLEDALCLCCCAPCVICTDARHLDAACKAGHKAVEAPKEDVEA